LSETKRSADDRHQPEAVTKNIWDHLEAGARQGIHPWHLVGLATVENGLPRNRTVVLRAINQHERWLCCHADVRSPKVAQIASQPEVAWLFYDPFERVQLRVTGKATLHASDAFADERWAASSLDSRRCYLAPYPQGQILPGPQVNLPDDLLNGPPTLDRSEAGRPNFCAIKGSIERFDWYDLNSAGHLRLEVTWPDGLPRFNWLAA
jgi:pyridoxamine 5'-phosphate oxidase